MKLLSYFSILIFILLSTNLLKAQDTTLIHLYEYNPDSTLWNTTFSIIEYKYNINHNPSKEDSITVKNHSLLISKSPNKRNFHNYYLLASSLWELEDLPNSEKMFLRILKSNKSFYKATYRHASDISNDEGNTYGYGSFTSNYKNEACLYLTKIYIEKGEFKQALGYLEDARNKYVVSFSCGTGHNIYQDELDGLKQLCMEGLQE